MFGVSTKGIGPIHGFIGGIAVGALALYLYNNYSAPKMMAPPASQPKAGSADTSVGTGTASYVGILPGNELPFFDDLEDNYVTSEVWDRRTSVYRNDGVIYNTVGRGGSGLMLDGTSGWDANKGLNVAGAYGNSLERDERTRQQHAGGSYPECKAIGGEFSC